MIKIAKTKNKGRGVFAVRTISKKVVIEKAPILGFKRREERDLRKTAAKNYYFEWAGKEYDAAIALGKVSLCNHSYDPNCVYRTDYKNDMIILIARRKIKKGEEITINYNYYPKSKNPLWFEVK